MCIFSQHNFIKDAPFSRLDIISCRNLLIYLNNDLQNRIIPLFHFSLLPGGFLFLGNSENVTRHAKLFAPIDRRYRVFRKLETGSRVLPDFPLTAVSDRPRGEPGPRPRGAESNLARRAERVAERYAPAYAVVDEHHEALHFSGRTGRFLDPTTGTATLNLVNLVHRDLRLDLRAALQKAAAENAPVKVPPLRMGVNGEAVAVNISVEPVTGSPDEPQHFIVLFQAGESVADDSEAAATEQALRESEERFRRMAGAVPIVLFTALPDLRFDYVNERFHELTGMTAASASDHGWLTALHPDDVEPVREAWREAASAERPLELEMRVRTPQIGYRWMLVRAEAIRDAKGKIERWYGSASDVNDLKLATERQNLLMAELQHRVKNILAVVRSIFTRTAEAGDSMEEMADHFRGRLDALARTQTVLARSPDGSIELEDLVRDELLSVGAPMDDKVAIAGAPVRLRHKAAEALGLAVHELATNAIKYGALVNDGGMIEIDWRVIDDKDDGKPRLHFEWREKGVRIVNAEPPRSGFGTELITQGLAYQLGATAALEFAPGGVRCAINVPLVETLLP